MSKLCGRCKELPLGSVVSGEAMCKKYKIDLVSKFVELDPRDVVIWDYRKCTKCLKEIKTDEQ